MFLLFLYKNGLIYSFIELTILGDMAPKILQLATWFVKKSSLNHKSWLLNGDQAKTLILFYIKFSNILSNLLYLFV